MTRAEHVRWCKQRAREYVNMGDLSQAVASMISDLGKHEETVLLAAGPISMIGLMDAASGDRSRVVKFIEGFAE